MNKYLPLLLSILLGLCSCKKEKVYFEYLFSETGVKNFCYSHYLYVGGDYDVKDIIFEEAAIQHFDTIGFNTPISGITFLRSKAGTERNGLQRPYHRINFDKVSKNRVVVVVFDLAEEYIIDSVEVVPPIAHIFYPRTGEIIKKESIHFKYLHSEEIEPNSNRDYLFVGGDYNLKNDIFEKAACLHIDTMATENPIMEVTFLYSTEKINNRKRPKQKLNTDFYNLKDNKLLTIVYDRDSKHNTDSTFVCPPVRYIFYNKTGEVVKRD